MQARDYKKEREEKIRLKSRRKKVQNDSTFLRAYKSIERAKFLTREARGKCWNR
jgi:hypothetical protein